MGLTFDTLCVLNHFAISDERMYAGCGEDSVIRPWAQGKRPADFLMTLARSCQPLYYTEENLGNQRRPPRNWDAVRAFLTDLQDNLCDICGETLASNDKQCDHVFPRNVGGTYVITNLRMTHRNCNRWKSDKIVGEPEANLRTSFEGLLPEAWLPVDYWKPLLSLSLNYGQILKSVNRVQRVALRLARPR
jgi:hypothetical protein